MHLFYSRRYIKDPQSYTLAPLACKLWSNERCDHGSLQVRMSVVRVSYEFLTMFFRVARNV